MATNEVYKYSDWIPLPLSEDAADTVAGDPVLVGGLVGVAQAVGGVTITVSSDSSPTLSRGGGMTISYTESSTSLEPGYASVALVGAWAFEIDDTDTADVGDAVYITQGVGGDAATLSYVSGGADMRFGYLINTTSDGRAIVRIDGGAV